MHPGPHLMGAGPKDGVLRWLEEYAARLHSGRYRVAQITDAGVPPTLALSIFDQARPAAADAVIHALPHCAAHQTVSLRSSSDCAVSHGARVLIVVASGTLFMYCTSSSPESWPSWPLVDLHMCPSACLSLLQSHRPCKTVAPSASLSFLSPPLSWMNKGCMGVHRF